MIVKSMSRKKSPAFRQLLGYFFRDGFEEHALYTRNLYTLPERGNWLPLAKEFEDNERLLPIRKNGNHAYHELIALEHQPHLSIERQTAILHDLAEQYVSRRAPNQLALGYVHSDTEYMHIHLMLSANEVRGESRVRLSRAEMQIIVCDLEDYKFEHYPELIGERLQGRTDAQADRVHVTKEGYAAARRQGHAQTRTEQVRAAISKAFEQSTSHDDVAIKLERAGFALYQRGKTWGVEHAETGRKYRLKTLGLLEAFKQSKARHGLVAKHSRELATFRQQRLHRTAEREINGWDGERGR